MANHCTLSRTSDSGSIFWNDINVLEDRRQTVRERLVIFTPQDFGLYRPNQLPKWCSSIIAQMNRQIGSKTVDAKAIVENLAFTKVQSLTPIAKNGLGTYCRRNAVSEFGLHGLMRSSIGWYCRWTYRWLIFGAKQIFTFAFWIEKTVVILSTYRGTMWIRFAPHMAIIAKRGIDGKEPAEGNRIRTRKNPIKKFDRELRLVV